MCVASDERWIINPVYELIHTQAGLHPEKTAVICNSESINYRDLDKKSDLLAAKLVSNGISKGERVALLLQPGINLVLTVLGAMKAGSTYIPLSASYPEKRIASILQTSGCRTIICDKENKPLVSNISCEKILIDKVNGSSVSRVDLSFKFDPDDSAYILFTSGSTGIPKGVNILHRNLSYYTQCISDLFEKTVGNRLPLTSSINFAAAVSQIYSCLSKGETLHILPEYLNDPQKIFNWYKDHSDYGLYCVPTVWRSALEWLNIKKKQTVTAPSVLFLSGENIPESLIEETFRRFPNIEIWNLYGPTEAVANLSYKQLTPGTDITIGNPLPGTNFYVVKDNGREADVGEQGLLYASGPGICSGYLGDEALSKQAFFDFNSEKDGIVRVYNTGDIVARVDENEYKFIGRKDQQVKIHGQRIELLEIENHLNNHPDVALGVVSLVSGNENYIAAYIKAKSGKLLTISGLREYMLTFLTDAMVPERWVFVDEFPRLANGKINRKSLPEPSDERPDLDSKYAEATDEKEKELITIFEHVLKINGVGLNDNFFELGGNSLKALDLLIEIEESFKYRFNFQTIFKNPTPKSLLKIIPELNQIQNNSREIITIVDSRIPLYPRQKGLWFFLQAHPENAAYNIAYSIKIGGKLDIDKLEKALERIILRHQSLHSVLKTEDDGPYFYRDRNVKINLNCEQTDLIPEEKKYDFIRNSISTLAAEPFNLSDNHLYRFKLYKVNENEHVLGFVVNHLVFDGGSFPIFIKELNNFYTKGLNGSPVVSLTDVLNDSEEYEKSARYDSDIRFWKSYLKGVNELHSFPGLFKEQVNMAATGGRISASIDGSLRRQIAALCKEKKITLNMLLLGVFGVALSKFGAQNEYVIASPFSNRLKKRDKDRIGYFVNTVLYRLNSNADRRFSDLINDIKDDTIRILDHQQTPANEIAAILRKEGVRLSDSLFKVMFGFHDVTDWTENQSELSISAEEVFNRFAKCDLYLECFDNKESIGLEFTYDRKKIDESAGMQVIRLFKKILKEVIYEFDSKLTELARISGEEKELVLRYSRGEKIDYDTDLTLYHLFLEASRVHAKRTAISFQDEELSYEDLQTKINQCIVLLSKLELKDKEPIGIYMDHRPGMVVSILAASAMAHPYVPLDPAYPEARNKYILGHAGVRCVFTTSETKRTIFDENIQLIAIDEVLKDGKTDVTVANHLVKPEDLLYIIYTSGSTGNPKGVMVPNKGVANYLLWMKNDFNIDTETRILAKTSLSFDISVWELFLPLISGGILVLENRSDIESPEQLARVINKKHVDIVQFVPSGLKLFCDSGMLKQTQDLRKIFCGGEKLTTNLRDDVLDQFDGELHNLYGPTEASIFMSHYRCTTNEKYENIPIGRPIPNSSIYVLDKNNRLLPRGVPGYLYIGGEVLAEGYRNDVGKTSKAFINGTDQIKERLYCTGDMGRMLFDGNLEFLGRNDHQVKIRGYRVELGEIESTMSGFPGVKQVVVFKSVYDDKDIRLNALIVPSGSDLSVEDLKNELRSKLPQYMIPSSFKLVEKIPLLPNGKINFKEIEKMKAPLVQSRRNAAVGNNEENIENVIFNIWADVIGQDNFETTDNFFDVGGHSILFLKIRDKIKERLNADFSIVDLYEYPNIKALAKKYKEKYSSPPPAIKAIKNRIENRKRRTNGKR